MIVLCIHVDVIDYWQLYTHVTVDECCDLRSLVFVVDDFLPLYTYHCGG